jgi:glycolate oxidase FAD binding subunit
MSSGPIPRVVAAGVPRRIPLGRIGGFGSSGTICRGVAFKGGGRVVKNVAGYDFCKLLTGSLGTLGVITQLALKVKPKSESAAAIIANCSDFAAAEGILGRLVNLPAPPVAIDLLVGSTWRIESAIPHQSTALVVRVEGTESEVASLAEQTQYELWSGGGADVRQLDADEADALWSRQIEFSNHGAGQEKDESPLVVKIAVPPSAVTATIAHLLSIDANCTIQAHAGNGIVIARFSQFSHADMTNVLVAKLRPAAMRFGGSLIVVSCKLEGLTPHLIWGGRTKSTILAERVKLQFDPRGILNPGRFII